MAVTKLVNATSSAREKYEEVQRIVAEIEKAERHLAHLREQKREAIKAWGNDPGTMVEVKPAP